jgi:hypothetical protein
MAPDAQAVAKRAIALRHLAAFALDVPPRALLARWKRDWDAADLREFRQKAREDLAQRKETVGGWIRCFTRRERAVFDCNAENLSDVDQMNAGWRAEGVYVLAWALRARDRLPPYDKQVSIKALADFPPKDFARFVRSARLRPRAQIEAARELAEFWHWRSRTRQLAASGEPPFDPPVDGIGSYDDIVRTAVKNARRRGDLRPFRQDFRAFGRAYRDLSDEQWYEVRSITAERHFTLNWLCGHAPRNAWEQTPTDS